MGQRGGRKKEDRREGRGELHCPIPTPTPSATSLSASSFSALAA